MQPPKLFMILLGCRPAGRHTEQHDIFFGIATSLNELAPAFGKFWKGAGKIHIDAWREVTKVDGYAVSVLEKTTGTGEMRSDAKIFFLNLGGYKPGEFEEFHYKMLAVAKDKTQAIQAAKQTAFYKHTGFRGAESHIDDKYGVDVDDVYEISDILPQDLKEKYRLLLKPAADGIEDEWHLGYTKLSSL